MEPVSTRNPGSVRKILAFALKHEGVQLAILHEALKQVPAEALAAALTAQRSSAYLRRTAFLWEKANRRPLALPWASAGGSYLDFFDPAAYYTGPVWERSSRYRINFNGLGPWAYCPTLARDDALATRGQADELRLLQPGQLERIEAIVAERFFPDGPQETPPGDAGD